MKLKTLLIPGVLGLLGVGAYMWWKKKQATKEQASLPASGVRGSTVGGVVGSSLNVSPDLKDPLATPTFFKKVDLSFLSKQ